MGDVEHGPHECAVNKATRVLAKYSLSSLRQRPPPSGRITTTAFAGNLIAKIVQNGEVSQDVVQFHRRGILCINFESYLKNRAAILYSKLVFVSG